MTRLRYSNAPCGSSKSRWGPTIRRSPFPWTTWRSWILEQTIFQVALLLSVQFTIQVCDQEFIIATTRPELLPACVALYRHPDIAELRDRKQNLKRALAFKKPEF